MFFSATNAAEATYVFTTINVPGSVATEQASGINDSGQIAGYFLQRQFEGFLTDNKSIKLSVPGSSATEAFGINNSGEIVGTWFTGSGGQNAFLYAKGSFQSLGLPMAQANGINDTGQIVGFYNGPAGFEGFSYKNGSIRSILYPGAIFTETFGVNDAGQIIGSYADTLGLMHSFIYADGKFTPVNVPGQAMGINNNGQIVGYLSGPSGFEGFVYNHGGVTTLSVPGSVATQALGINDAGQVVGTYFDSSQQQHAFLATPIAAPEPSTAAIIGIAGPIFALLRLVQTLRLRRTAAQ